MDIFFENDISKWYITIVAKWQDATSTNTRFLMKGDGCQTVLVRRRNVKKERYDELYFGDVTEVLLKQVNFLRRRQYYAPLGSGKQVFKR